MSESVKVWFCEVHRSIGTEHVCDGMELIKAGNFRYHNECRIVEMELVPIEPLPAPYDIEIPDFVNRHGTW